MRKAIGFDLDGTLWDTVAGCVGGWNAALARHPEAGARLTEEAMRSYMGLTTEEIAARLLPELPLSSALPIMDECTQEEYAYLRSVGGWHLFPGVREGLERLARDYDLFLVSNCQCGYIELFLELSGTKEFVRAHLCPGDTGKKKGDNICLALEALGCPRAFYLGDTVHDEAAARQAGLPFVHAAYGFGRADSPDAVLERFSDLPILAARLLA